MKAVIISTIVFVTTALLLFPWNAAGNTLTVTPYTDQFPYVVLLTEIYDPNGNPIVSSSRDDFSIYEIDVANGVQHAIEIDCFTSSFTVSGITFSLVFDVSSSMESTLAEAKAAVNNFIQLCNSNDMGSLVTFSTGGTEKIVMPLATVVKDEDRNQVRDLADAVNQLSTGGTTAVFDATAKGIESLAGAPYPKVVILFSDGKSNSDQSFTMDQVIADAKSQKIPLYTIGLRLDSANLSEMAAQTGGQYHYAPSVHDMSAIYTDLYAHFARNLEKQYRLTYLSRALIPDGSTHTYSLAWQDETATGTFQANVPPVVILGEETLALAGQSRPAGVALVLAGTFIDTNAFALDQQVVGTLYYRNIGTREYQQVGLALIEEEGGNFSWQGSIPASVLVSPGVEYYLTVSDGLTTTHFPATYASLPLVVPVLDHVPPAIMHTVIETSVSNQAIPVQARVVAPTPGQLINAVSLYYRPRDPYNQIEFIKLDMVPGVGNTYTVDIPASHVLAEGIDYFIVATDSMGVRNDHGLPFDPHVIAVDGAFQTFPQVLAGEDQLVTEAQTVMLDGSQSSDPDVNDTISYRWEQIDGPAVILDAPNEARPVFIAPNVGGAPESAIFLLRISDSTCRQATDTVNITISDSAPIAQFSWTPSKPAVNTTVSFIDQSEFDVDEITGWHWRLGDQGESTEPSPTVAFSQKGLYEIQLTVTDADGSTASMTKILEVTGLPPVANAGPDQTVQEGEVVSLDGSESVDSDSNDPLSYSWTQISGSTVSLLQPESVQPEFEAPDVLDDPIVLVFELTVTDADGLEDSDRVSIIVEKSPCVNCSSNSGCFISTLEMDHCSKPQTKQQFYGMLLLGAMSVLLLSIFRILWKIRWPVKRSALIIVLTPCLYLLGGIDVNAEIETGKVSFTPFIGGYIFDNHQNIDTGVMGGVAGAYQLSPRWGVEVLGAFIDSTHPYIDALRNVCLDEDVEVMWGSLNGVYHLRPQKKVVPYVIGGVGYLDLDYEHHDHFSSGFLNYGGGLHYFLKSNLSLRTDLRHIYTFEKDYNNLSFWMGISFLWGAKPKHQPVPQTPPAPEEPQAVPPAPQIVPPVPPAAMSPVFLSITFELDQAIIQGRYAIELEEVVAYLKADPSVKVIVRGHTCTIGTAAYNLRLSQKRANAVMDYLITKGRIEKHRVTAEGVGETQPLANNETEAGRRKNRCVVIHYH